MKKILYKKISIFLLFLLLSLPAVNAKKILSDAPIVAIKIHNENGELVGTCRRENLVFNLYDLKEKRVENPAKYMKQSENDCYLYNIEGYAVGKCTSSKVILFKY